MSKEWCFGRSPAVSWPWRTIRWCKYELLEARKGSIKWSVPYLAITFEIKHAWIIRPGSIIASKLFSFRPYKFSTSEEVRQRKLESSQSRFLSDETERNDSLDIGKVSRNRIRGTGRPCVVEEAVVRQYLNSLGRIAFTSAVHSSYARMMCPPALPNVYIIAIATPR